MTMHPRNLVFDYDLLESRPSGVLAINDMSLNVPELGNQPVNIGNMNAALRDARTRFGAHMRPRNDSFGWEGDEHGRQLAHGRLSAYQRRQDRLDIARLRSDYGRELGPNAKRLFAEWRDQRIERLADEMNIRRDAAANLIPGGVGGFPRDFDHIRTKIWEEERQPLTALDLFPTDTSIPLGARTHTARRRLGRGIAKIMRGDSFIPRANIGYVEEQFGVVYIVCGVGQNFFETLTTDFANLNAYEEGLRHARRLVEERMNDVFWYGDVASQVYGVLNYPSLAKVLLPLGYDDSEYSTNADLVAARRQLVVQLLDLGATPSVRSGTKFEPNRLAMSPALISYMAHRKHELEGGTDTTMLKYFLDNNQFGIRNIDKAPELAGIGPNGEDGILYYRDDSDAIHSTVLQSPTTLPVYQSGPLDQLTVVYGAIGGMVMGNVGHHVLGYARVRSF